MKHLAISGLLIILTYGMVIPVTDLCITWNHLQVQARLKRKTHSTEAIFFKKGIHPDWKKKGKEFKLNGTLYDVVRIKTTANGSWYLCYKDNLESLLSAMIDAFPEHSVPISNNPNQTLLLSLCAMPPPLVCLSIFSRVSINTFPQTTSFIKPIYFVVAELPPKELLFQH